MTEYGDIWVAPFNIHINIFLTLALKPTRAPELIPISYLGIIQLECDRGNFKLEF